MIPVEPADEPATFDAKVRQPGLKWLASKGLTGAVALPPKTKMNALWTKCLNDMMTAYGSICAYASLRIHGVTGAKSADHFAPKSKALNLAYEWDNYRLACSKLNARKNNFSDVLDPFTLAPGTFELVVGNGALRPAPSLVGQALTDATLTVTRLKLDDGEMRAARLDIIDAYLRSDFTTAYLALQSPFIHSELSRLGLLRP